MPYHREAYAKPYTLARGVRIANVMVDPVLARKLADLIDDTDRERLVRHVLLKRSTAAFGTILDFLSGGRGISGTIRFTQGWAMKGGDPCDGAIGYECPIEGSEHGIVWNDGLINIRGMTLPMTMAQAMRGRRLGDVVDHPMLPANDPIGSMTVNGSTTTITLAVKRVRKAA